MCVCACEEDEMNSLHFYGRWKCISGGFELVAGLCQPADSQESGGGTCFSARGLQVWRGRVEGELGEGEGEGDPGTETGWRRPSARL